MLVLGQKAQSIVDRLHQFVFGIQFPLFYLGILIIALLENGIGFFPWNSNLILFSQDLTTNPFASDWAKQWGLSSFLGPFLAFLTGANKSPLSYALMHLAIFLVCFPVLMMAIRHQYGDFAARTVLILFVLSPVSTVVLTWLGTPDVLTVLLAVAMVLCRKRPIWLFVAAALLGTNHPEQGLAIAGILGIESLLTQDRRDSLRLAVAAFGGVILGAELVQWYFQAHHFGVVFTREDFVAVFARDAVRYALQHPVALLLSLFNAALPFVAAYLHHFGRTSKASIAFALQCCLAFALTLITFDQTRVFALLTFPALVLLALSPSVNTIYFRRILTVCLLLGLVVPRFLVWNGNLYGFGYLFINMYPAGAASW